MRKILEYLLEEMDLQVIYIPIPANLLSVAEKSDRIVLFAMVEEELEKIPVDIRIIQTDVKILDDIDTYKFLGTVKLEKGVFHIFGRHSKDDKRKYKESREFSGITIEDVSEIDWRFKKPVLGGLIA